MAQQTQHHHHHDYHHNQSEDTHSTMIRRLDDDLRRRRQYQNALETERGSTFHLSRRTGALCPSRNSSPPSLPPLLPDDVHFGIDEDDDEFFVGQDTPPIRHKCHRNRPSQGSEHDGPCLICSCLGFVHHDRHHHHHFDDEDMNEQEQEEEDMQPWDGQHHQNVQLQPSTPRTTTYGDQYQQHKYLLQHLDHSSPNSVTASHHDHNKTPSTHDTNSNSHNRHIRKPYFTKLQPKKLIPIIDHHDDKNNDDDNINNDNHDNSKNNNMSAVTVVDRSSPHAMDLSKNEEDNTNNNSWQSHSTIWS